MHSCWKKKKTKNKLSRQHTKVYRTVVQSLHRNLATGSRQATKERNHKAFFFFFSVHPQTSTPTSPTKVTVFPRAITSPCNFSSRSVAIGQISFLMLTCRM